MNKLQREFKLIGCKLLEEQKASKETEEEVQHSHLIEFMGNTQAMMELIDCWAERTSIKGKKEMTDRKSKTYFMKLYREKKESILLLSEHKKKESDLLPRHKRELKSMCLRTEKAKKRSEEGERKHSRKRKKMLGRKRAGKEQQKESSKKQKVEEGQESEEVDEDNEVELKKILVIKKDEDIAIDAIPLATKLPVIIDYKLHKEGMLVHYQLIRADRSSKRYSSMIRMLQGIYREDLEALLMIVKVKYGDIRPKNEFERVLYGDLKVMFEPDIKSDVWRMLKGYRVTIWKLIDSSGVHLVSGEKENERFEMQLPGKVMKHFKEENEDSEDEHQV
ncbi:hypothetical protein Tco_0509027 [Tanacetum coccineum]